MPCCERRYVMRLALIGCQVMVRELSAVIASHGNECVPYWLPQGLHDVPEKLLKQLNEKILEVERVWEEKPPYRQLDYIVLGYALCGKGVSGIRAGKVPLVIPRVDDCISLFLGSRQRYLKYFRRYKGTYWFTPGWVESAGLSPSKELYEYKYNDYVERFGEENAEYLMEQENSWLQEYKNGIYITSQVCRNESYIKRARGMAESHGWDFRLFTGDMRYFNEMLDGNWYEERFLICPPGKTIIASDDEKVLIAVD